MLRRLKTVSMMLFLMGLSTGAAFATSATGVDDVKVTQQSETATGVVKDAFGEVVGASVVVKGTTNGVVTDFEGKFSLDGVKKGDILEISFVGYKTQEVKWNGTPLDILLTEDTEMLEEVVVVGYGTQKKTNLTGSVSMVDAEALEARPVQNVQQALQGVVPGLNMSVTSGGGALDAGMNMNIRGAGTIGSGSAASPLVLIDGMEGDMNTVNPNDIASISVLKDAASSSIYGARAAFGVILITTKNGSAGKVNVNYSGNVRFSSVTDLPEMLNSYDFARYFNAAAANAGQSPVFDGETLRDIQRYMNGEITYGTGDRDGDGKWDAYTQAFANTDWFGTVYKDWATSHEHNLSISGGTEKMNYRVSGSFLNQNGLIKFGEDVFNRYTIDAKISAKLADWITLNYATKWTRSDYDRPTYMTGLFFHNIARRWPTCPVYDPNGYLLEGMEIIQMSEGGIQTEQKNYYTQQVGLVIEPIKDWHINIEGSMRTYNRNQHWNVKPVYGHDVNGQPFLHSWDGGADYAPGQSRVYDYRFTEDYFTTNIFTDYSKTINDHYFKAMAGFNAELFKNSNIYGQGDALKDTDIPYLNMASDRLRTGGGANHTSIAGFFARINYSWKDRYMIELNGRYDGSSRFVGDKRWGFFPSTSLGWNIAREGFWENWEWGAENISTLKLRASWGQLGNTNTGDAWYPFYLSQATGNANSGYLINGQKQNTASMPGIVSNALTWETIESWNIGLDWNMFNNRLTGSFDWFTRYTYDMVGPAPDLPNALGTSVPKINNADMKSVGWELELGWRDRVGEVGYGVKLVLSDAVQTVERYPNENMSINDWYAGERLNNIWGFTTAGIAQSQEEMDAWIANNNPSWGGNWAAGDLKYVDLNGDGKVNQGALTLGDTGDYQIIGNSTPRYNFGINLDANWKGFDLSMFWQGTAKRDYWLGGPYFWGASGGMWQSAAFKEHMDFWRPEGHELGANLDAYYPRASFNGSKNQQVSTGYLQDASYIRLKNIQLGYSLPTSLIKKAGMSSVRVYVSADNLLTISDITGMFDPEALGGDWGEGKLYPLQKTISVGLNVNF